MKSVGTWDPSEKMLCVSETLPSQTGTSSGSTSPKGPARQAGLAAVYRDNPMAPVSPSSASLATAESRLSSAATSETPTAAHADSSTRLKESASQWFANMLSGELVTASATASVAAKETAAREGPSRL